MPKKRLYLLLVACVAVVMGLLFAVFHEPPELSYDGKKLSEWVDGDSPYQSRGSGLWVTTSR